MSENLDCYANIIGLSRNENCKEKDRPEDFDVSESGLYLDELPYMSLKMAEATGNLWKILTQSVSEATEDFKHEFLMLLRTKQVSGRKPYKGYISEPAKANGEIKIDRTYHGAKMNFARIKGGIVQIKRIGTWFNQSTSLTVAINVDGEEVNTLTLETEANKLKWNDVDLHFDMKEIRDVSFIYENSLPNLKAKNLRVSCGCGGFAPYFDILKPAYYTTVNKGRYPWADWMQAIGIKGNDINKLTTANETQGLVFDVNILCNYSLCDFDFENNPVDKVIAHAIRYKAGSYVLTRINASGDPSRFTLLDGATIQERATEYDSQFFQRINFLVEEMSKPENVYSKSDCFTCLNESGFIKETIRV